jgi:hypothetical protein
MKLFRNILGVSLSGVLLLSPNLLLPLKSLAQNSDGSARFQTLAEADRLYREDRIQEAENLYRQVKPDFPNSPANLEVAEPVYEIEELDGGQRAWNNALDGIEKGLESKIFLYLRRLTKDYPEFIPGHLKLAEACQEDPEACDRYAQDGGAKNALEVLERATNLYPDDPDLLKAKVTALADAEQFLEASVAARQYSLIYLDYAEAPEFAELADKYLKRYQSKVREQLITQGILNVIISGGIALVTDDVSQGVSSLKAFLLMLKGESGFGEEVAMAFVQDCQQQENLFEDPEVLNYLKGISGRFTPYIGRDFEYEFYVVEDNTLNAFALPGGKVFVNTGAILKTNSEAELAGLVAHEIAHAALSHGFQNIAQRNFLNSLGQLAGQVIPAQDVVPFIQDVLGLANKQYSREQERQADILSTRALAASGYAADGLRNVMVTLKEQRENTSTKLTDSHPAPVERIRYLERLIQDNGYNRYGYEGVQKHREIKRRIDKDIPEIELPEPDQPEAE